MLSSTIHTIGTALNRARDCGVPVEVLVDGHWIKGDVSAVDGHGVVLHCEDGALSVLRVERIDAVLVRQAEAFAGQRAPERDDGRPMPAPVDLPRARTTSLPRSCAPGARSRRSGRASRRAQVGEPLTPGAKSSSIGRDADTQVRAVLGSY